MKNIKTLLTAFVILGTQSAFAISIGPILPGDPPPHPTLPITTQQSVQQDAGPIYPWPINPSTPPIHIGK